MQNNKRGQSSGVGSGIIATVSVAVAEAAAVATAGVAVVSAAAIAAGVAVIVAADAVAVVDRRSASTGCKIAQLTGTYT